MKTLADKEVEAINVEFPKIIGSFFPYADVKEFIKKNIADLDELIEHTHVDTNDCGCYICHNQREFRETFEELKKKQIKRAGEKLTT